MKHTEEEKLAAFGHVLDVMDKLRAGCPWNAAQTWDTLRPMTVEEVYELSDAVMKKSGKDVEKELGDLLLHIVFYAKVAEEQGEFDIVDVCRRLCEKMIFRHPHVFSDKKASDAEQVSENWELMKMKEKGGNKRVLSGVPDSMPPILKAYSMQDKARESVSTGNALRRYGTRSRRSRESSRLSSRLWPARKANWTRPRPATR